MQVERSGGRLYWVQKNRQKEFYTPEMGEHALDSYFHRIDPQFENAACGWKIRTEQGWDIVFQAHHAALDGLGGLQMVSEWMIAYANELNPGKKTSLRRLDTGQLARRNHLGIFSRQFLSRLHCQPLAIFGAGKFFWRQVTPLLPTCGENSSSETIGAQLPAGYPKLESRILRETSLQRLKASAKRQHVSLHAILLQELLLTMHQWRKEKGFYRENERLRLMIPMSIRTASDRRLPAANRATIVQIDRSDRHFNNRDQMLYWINDELGFVRRCHLQYTYLILARVFALFPRLMRRMAWSPRCRATSAITNLGSPFDRLKLPREQNKIRAGDLVLEDFDLVVPLRPATPVGFAVAGYAEKFKISMHFDPRILGQDQAISLIDLFVQRLQAVV